MQAIRRARLCLLIKNEHANNWYTVAPLPTLDDFAVGFRLIKQTEPHDSYAVTLTDAGAVRCTCPGHASHKHCKHADALTALGIIDPDEYLAKRKAQLEAEQERDLLQQERSALAAERRTIEAAARILDNHRAVRRSRAKHTIRCSRCANTTRDTQTWPSDIDAGQWTCPPCANAVQSDRANRTPDPVAIARQSIALIDMATISGKRKAKKIVAGIAAQHGVNPSDLWRDTVYQPDGFAETVQ